MPDQLATTMADVLGKGGAPALSATSDMPTIEQTAVTEAVETKPADVPTVDKPAEAVAADPAVDTPVDATAEPAADAKPVKKDGKSGISERFSEMSTQRKAAEDRATKLTDSLEKALSAIDKLSAKPAAEAAVVAAEPRPKRETFDNPDAYDEALVEWSSREATKVATANAEKERLEHDATTKKDAEEKQARETFEVAQKTWNDRRAKATEEFPDYAEVVDRDDLQISLPMAHTIMNAENGPAIAYHLGKNPDEAARIAALPPPMQVFALGQIAFKLAQPKPNVSKAPAPIKPLGSQASASAKTPDEMSMDEYAAYRQPKLAEQRRSRTH